MTHTHSQAQQQQQKGQHTHFQQFAAGFVLSAMYFTYMFVILPTF
jgi:hypothetical protein